MVFLKALPLGKIIFLQCGNLGSLKSNQTSIFEDSNHSLATVKLFIYNVNFSLCWLKFVFL